MFESFGLSSVPKNKVPDKWGKEQKVIKAIQVAFDLDAQVQYVIRREALDLGVNPSEKLRQILGLRTSEVKQRPRLSVSLKPEDFDELARQYGLDSEDRVAIKQKANLEIQKYCENKEYNKNE